MSDKLDKTLEKMREASGWYQEAKTSKGWWRVWHADRAWRIGEVILWPMRWWGSRARKNREETR